MKEFLKLHFLLGLAFCNIGGAVAAWHTENVESQGKEYIACFTDLLQDWDETGH